jgi:hypothetical protein
MRNYGELRKHEYVGLRVSRCWGIDPETGARKCYTQVKHDCPMKKQEKRLTIITGIGVAILGVVNGWLFMAAL